MQPAKTYLKKKCCLPDGACGSVSFVFSLVLLARRKKALVGQGGGNTIIINNHAFCWTFFTRVVAPTRD